jgi:spore coat protein H
MTQPFQIKPHKRSAGGWFIVFSGSILLALSLWGVSAPENTGETDNSSAQGKASNMLFVENKIWNVELEFEKEQYAAMKPKERMDYGMGGAADNFGLGNILAPTIFKEGDSNNDGWLSKQEFVNLGRTWFQKWDAAHAGQVEAAVIKNDISEFFLQSALNPVEPGDRFENQASQPAREYKKKGVGFLDEDFPWAKANLVFDGNKIPQVSVRYKGNSTYTSAENSLKRPLKVDLSKGFQGRKLYGVHKLNFHNAVTDGSWMKEVIAYQLFRDAGVPAGRTSYARVYVTVPGKFNNKYFGLYSIVEDPDKDFAKAHYGTKQGAIFKPFTRHLFEDAGADWKAYQKAYNPKTETTEDEKKRLIEFCKLISHADDAELTAKIGKYLDLDEVARYLAVTVWLCDWDSPLSTGQNFFVYLHPKTNLFHLVPWDLDLTFGHFAWMKENPEQLSIMHPWSGRNLFLERLFKLDEFKRIYLARMKEFSKTIFRAERIHKQVDELAAILRPAVKEESEEKLTKFDQLVADKSAGGMMSGTSDRSRGMGTVGKSQPIKVFSTARALSVESQLDEKSEGKRLSRGGTDQFDPMEGMGGGGDGGFGGVDGTTAEYVAKRVKSEKPSTAAEGKWLIKNWEKEIKLEFKVEGVKLTGTIDHSQLPGTIEIKDGKIEGDKISFNYVRRMDGQDFKMLWTGTLSGDEIKFKREYVSVGPGGGGGQGGFDGMDNGLTRNQKQKINDAVHADVAELNTKLQDAQKAAMAAALGKNATEDNVKAKVDAVLKVQTEIAMLRYNKGVKSIVKDITDDQRTQLNKNAARSYQQLFGANPAGFGEFEQLMGQSMASSFLKALGIGQEARVTQKQFEEGFARWFESRDTDHSGTMSEAQLAAGLNKIMGIL